MKALQITQSDFNGKQLYKFESRKIEYSVFVDNTGGAEVWTTNRQLGGMVNVAVYNTMDELSGRSKAFESFVSFLKNDAFIA